MSAAAAEPVQNGEAPAPPKKGKKKLLFLILVLLLVLGAGGIGAVMVIQKKRLAAAEAAARAEGEDAPVEQAARQREVRKTPPAFLPLEPFIVNLADRDVDRFAQIGVTLELEDPKSGDRLKAYMPAIRNGILMVLAHKTSQQLLGRAGKEALAAEILRESMRPLGIDVDEEIADTESDPEERPVRQVHFSSFIIQ
jgi:flagellar FliL protein